MIFLPFLVEKNFEVSGSNSLILPGSCSHFTWFVSPNMAVKRNSGFHSASTLLCCMEVIGYSFIFLS